MQVGEARRFRFEDYELDLQTRALTLHSNNVPLRSKSFDVLAHLVVNAGKLATKDEIVSVVWPGVIASDESLSRCISDIRSAIRDDERQVIRTVPGRGYQFTAEVFPAASQYTATADRNIPLQAGRRIWVAMTAIILLVLGGIGWQQSLEKKTDNGQRASIAVMPFRNSNGDPEIEPFVAGLTLDLNSALARVPEMLVISENTMRRYKNAVSDVRIVAETVGVDHVLTGAVQRSGDQVRVSVQLLDKDEGSAIWSERYDRPLSDFLELQDDIVKRVLVGLQVELTHGESIRMDSSGTDNLEAWLANIEALAEGFEFKRENNQNARDLFSKASRLDPDWAAPIGGIAWTYREAIRRGWSSDPESDRKEWFRFASKCKETDPEFYGCYIQLGNYLIENDQVEDGIALREEALALAPSDLSVLSGLGWQLILVGQVKRGLELLQRAKLVSPLHPPWLIATEAYGFQVDGQYEKAIAGFKYALENGNFPDWHARIAAVYVQIGDMENARKHARLFIEQQPSRTVADLTQILKIQDPEQTRQYANLLRTAGIPD